MTLTLDVKNMHCEACAKRVRNVIAKKDPEAEVEVDLGAGKVAVRGGADVQTLVAALETAGYPVASVNDAR